MFARSVDTEFRVARPVHAHFRLYVIILRSVRVAVNLFSLQQSHSWPSYLLPRWAIDSGITA